MESEYSSLQATINGREAVVFCPKNNVSNGRWVLKTEYLRAFPDVQNRLLSMGYHLAHIKNRTCWGRTEDVDAQAALAEYMHATLGLSQKGVLIGMSCGGMQAIYLAARYPQYVSCMYLDAPVVNFLSCPAALGASQEPMIDEFQAATGITLTQLLSYRNHPQDHIPELIASKIPVILVCGDSDTVVPYEENGAILDRMYRESNCVIETIIKKGCDHHPHGLEDNTPVVSFIQKYDTE